MQNITGIFKTVLAAPATVHQETHGFRKTAHLKVFVQKETRQGVAKELILKGGSCLSSLQPVQGRARN